MSSIRPCTKADASQALRVVVGYEVDLTDTDTYLIDEQIVLGVVPHGDIAEVHIGIPYRKRGAARESLALILNFLQGCGYAGIFTQAPESRKGLCKMLENLGFSKQTDSWVMVWAG